MASDGLDRNGDPEARNAEAKEVSVLKQESCCGPCRTDYTSPPPNKKVDENSCFHDNHSSCFLYGETVRGQDVDVKIPLLSDNKGKHSARKSTKESIATPTKRPRIDESENFMRSTGTNAHEDIPVMVGFDPIRCTTDKSHITTQKRVHDGKRADKKNCRASMKNRYEFLASKSGLVCSDTFSGGNSIFGSHGVKSDIHDMAKQFDELSLFDLLNGSYRYHALPVDKGKKSSNTNDNILLSVRKASSILCPPPIFLAENCSNSKACQSSQDPSFSTGSTSDYETKDKRLEESIKKGKGQDTSQANWIKSTIYPPKHILEQLALPAASELETFLFNSSGCSIPSKFTEKSKSSCGNNLAPFHWSFSHGTNNKPSVESCKVNATKNVCQGKWVRIGSSSSMIMGDKSFPKLDFMSNGDDMDSVNQKKIDDVLEWMKSFTSTPQPPGDGLSSKSSIIGTPTQVQDEENMNSVNGSGILGPFNSKSFQLHGIAHKLNSNHLECGSKGHASHEGTASVFSRCSNEMNLDPSKFSSTFKDKEFLKDHPVGTVDGCFMSKFSYNCRNATAQSCDSTCPYCRTLKCKQAYPQELLSAAATLLEMSRHNTSPGKCLSRRNRWPKAPSLKKMKARKSSIPIINPDRPFASTGCNNLNRKANISSSEHQPAIEKRMDFVPPSSSGRESSRWSSPPNKVEKDPSQRVPHGNSSFRPSLTPFSSRAADKDCDYQIKEPQAKPPSVAFRGSSIRDWIRCRNKKL